MRLGPTERNRLARAGLDPSNPRTVAEMITHEDELPGLAGQVGGTSTPAEALGLEEVLKHYWFEALKIRPNQDLLWAAGTRTGPQREEGRRRTEAERKVQERLREVRSEDLKEQVKGRPVGDRRHSRR